MAGGCPASSMAVTIWESTPRVTYMSLKLIQAPAYNVFCTKVWAPLKGSKECFGHINFYTGMRPGEIRNLQWADLDFEIRRRWSIGWSKSGRSQLIGLTANYAREGNENPF